MIEYIHESSSALQRTLDSNEQNIVESVEQFRRKGIKHIILTGMGSSYTSAMMAFPIMRIYSDIPVHVIPSTELSYYIGSLISKETVVLNISRSGERGWVVEGLKQCLKEGALCIAVTGVEESSLARTAPIQWITQEGQEASFPKTKSVITCSGILMRLALALGKPGDVSMKDQLSALKSMPEKIMKITESLDPQIQKMIPFIANHSTFVICGTGSNYGTALEAAIKLQETTDITSLADDTGNFFHGPLAPLDSSWLLIQLTHSSDVNLSLQLIDLAKKIGSHSLCITEKGVDIGKHCDHNIKIPVEVNQMMASLAYLPVIQLINFYLAIELGKNPDRPEAAVSILNAILPPGHEEPDF